MIKDFNSVVFGNIRKSFERVKSFKKLNALEFLEEPNLTEKYYKENINLRYYLYRILFTGSYDDYTDGYNYLISLIPELDERNLKIKYPLTVEELKEKYSKYLKD